MNRVTLMGRVGQDPELKYTPGGTAVANFSVATSKKWTDKNGQKQEKSEWHRIVIWGKLGELANQYLAKGRQVLLEGELQTRAWDDKDGVKRYTTEIVANNLEFIGSAPSQNNQNGGSSSAPGDQSYNVSSDASFAADDIPF